MNGSEFDAAQFKVLSQKQWDSVAPAWRRWWSVIEQGAQVVSNHLVDHAQIELGHQVLDVATGIGEPALTAAQRVGPTGRVLATDVSAQMLDTARKRAAEAGVQHMDFHQIDAEELALPYTQFNAALCRWGLTELPNPGHAMRQIGNHLLSGGRFAAAVWDIPTNVPALSAPVFVVHRKLNPPPPPVGAPSPFGMADADILYKSFDSAGFTNIEIASVEFNLAFPSFVGYADFLTDISPMIQGLFSSQTEEKQKDIWKAVADVVDEYKQADGRYQLPASTICIVGQK